MERILVVDSMPTAERPEYTPLGEMITEAIAAETLRRTNVTMPLVEGDANA